MAQYTQTAKAQETAVLVALITPHQHANKTKEYLEELTLLTHTLGMKTIATFTQHLERRQAKTLLGTGKLAEIKKFVKDNQVDKVIFDDELTHSQVRNIKDILECEVLDRNLLILNIFAMRAKTRQAKTQVELAQYEYLLPRLAKMWAHLTHQKGGGTGMRGPGEKELETDHRIVKDKITLLRHKLKAIDRQNITQRKTRGNLVRVALVGYTNVGKSTLMQALSKATVYVEDKLFSTLSATVRRIVLKDIPCLLTDTVGFIRKLHPTLIAAFKSTLDEVREADILLHVIDISHPDYEEQIKTVQETLQEIGAANVPTILVFNKIDQWLKNNQGNTPEENNISLEALKNRYQRQDGHQVVFISAKEKQHIDTLKEILYEQVHAKHQLIYPNYLKTETY
jgi:GTP-binding protein HflX